MKLLKTCAVAVSFLAVATFASWEAPRLAHSSALAQPMRPYGGWHGMMGGWPMGQGWHGNGPMPRHHVAMMWGIPEPYTSMTNTLPRTQATLEEGAKVYVANCESCHGKEGLGDGDAGRGLSPQPGNLQWLSDMPMSQWDAFMYWTVAEGGSQFGTAMPAFRGSLSKNEIWAVTAYIQAHLPHEAE